MFLEQEKPEIDDLKRKTKIWFLKKNTVKMRNIVKKVFNGYTDESFTKYFCILFCFRTF